MTNLGDFYGAYGVWAYGVRLDKLDKLKRNERKRWIFKGVLGCVILAAMYGLSQKRIYNILNEELN